MNNQILFENYLLILKSTVEVYVHGTLESSNERVHNILKDSLNQILLYQHQTYNLMEENGWYPKENIDSNKISETINKLINKN